MCPFTLLTKILVVVGKQECKNIPLSISLMRMTEAQLWGKISLSCLEIAKEFIMGQINYLIFCLASRFISKA